MSNFVDSRRGTGPDTAEFQLNQEPTAEFWDLCSDNVALGYESVATIWNIRTLRCLLGYAGYPDRYQSNAGQILLFRSLHSMNDELKMISTPLATYVYLSTQENGLRTNTRLNIVGLLICRHWRYQLGPATSSRLA
jgi:hypothetical protein